MGAFWLDGGVNIMILVLYYASIGVFDGADSFVIGMPQREILCRDEIRIHLD